MFWAVITSDLESAVKSAVCVSCAQVHLFLCVSRVSADCVQCDFGKQRTRARAVDEA